MKSHVIAGIFACLIGAGSVAIAQTITPTQLVPANPTVEAPTVVQVPPKASVPPQRKAITTALPSSMLAASAIYPAVPSSVRALAHTAQMARVRATQVASSSTYVNAVAIYDYVPGQVYQIYTSPDYVTTIALKAGEKLISKVSGDTTRWVIGDTITGDTANQTILVVIKPVRPGLRTNLMLSTNQRVYQIDLVSLPGNQYQNAVSWNYPQDQLREAQMRAAAINEQASQTELTAVAIDQLNDHYDIRTKQGRTPDWMPRHIFDDGAKTYIEFPDNLGTTSAPPLFILGADGKADLVNYRVKGHFYIVDRLFDRAQLRVGQEPQTIVEIDRSPVGGKRSAGGLFGFLSRKDS
ncbi:MAG: P-type conjugative transfer protein TrbG [Rhizomicrobium sp.]